MSARIGVMILSASLGAACPVAADEALSATAGEIDAFLSADADKDTALSRAEFERFVRAMADQGQSTARLIRFFGAYEHAFSVADRDDDGSVTPIELREADEGYRSGAD